MKPIYPLQWLRLVFSIGIALSALGLASCDRHSNHYQGYIEGNLTYIASPFAGQLQQLTVTRGDSVKAGQPLYQLDREPQLSSLNQALATIKQLTASLADLEKGSRPSELASIQAQIEQADAQLIYAQTELSRSHKLVLSQSLAQEALDQNVQNVAVLENKIVELKNNLTTAGLGSRIDAINAARAAVIASQAAETQAEWELQQKTGSAPVAGLIFDTYSRVGEEVPANQPILSLLAPKDVKALFFVPEKQLASLKLGQIAHISCDGCTHNIQSTIRFISPTAEYTPPVIYSESTRNQLVFEVEATFTPATARQMHPGQPITITINDEP